MIENNGLTLIYIPSKESIQDSEMAQVEKNKFLGTRKETNVLIGWINGLRTYNNEEKIEGKKRIISTFATETKIDVNTSLKVNGECTIISTF